MQDRLPRGFSWLISAQFISALADHALLIVAIAHLQFLNAPEWWAPLLKFAFTLAYVFLAPFIGNLADRVCKRRLMAWMNALKWVGAAAMLRGAPPMLAFALVGMGASAYAPAKYGLITESVPPSRLVSANGWIECAVVMSVLLGTGLGGALVSSMWLQSELVSFVATLWPLTLGASSASLNVSLVVILMLYVVAGFLNLGIVPSGAVYPRRPLSVWHMSSDFWKANRTLWRDRSGGLSLLLTTVFWGVGALLQFAVLHWSVQFLGLTLDKAAYMQGIVALGVVVGAVWVATRLRLKHATSVLPVGILMGIVLLMSLWIPTWQLAVPSLLILGALGGILVVPMNALLQHRGHRLLTAGQSIAVQGFNENLSVLITMGVYSALIAADTPVRAVMAFVGVALAGTITYILMRRMPQRQGFKPLMRHIRHGGG